MKRRAFGTIAGIVGLILVAHGKIESAVPAEVSPQLDELAWLVGTWRGEGKTAAGKPAANVFRFEWAPHRKAFRYSIDQLVGNGATPVLVGLCTWHPVRARLVLWEVGNAGDVTESSLTISGNKILYEEVISGANGSTLPIRAEAVRDGNDAFIFRARAEQRGEWTVVFEMTWRRAK